MILLRIFPLIWDDFLAGYHRLEGYELEPFAKTITPHAVGLFSKLFGDSKPKTEPLMIPERATSRDVISIAIRSVIQQAGGNCVTLESIAEPSKWVQIMDLTINCHYPHTESPEWLFPELCNHPIVAGLEGYEEANFMTVSLSAMNQSEIAAWIERYFTQVLSIDLHTDKLSLRMEDL